MYACVTPHPLLVQSAVKTRLATLCRMGWRGWYIQYLSPWHLHQMAGWSSSLLTTWMLNLLIYRTQQPLKQLRTYNDMAQTLKGKGKRKKEKNRFQSALLDLPMYIHKGLLGICGCTLVPTLPPCTSILTEELLNYRSLYSTWNT